MTYQQIDSVAERLSSVLYSIPNRTFDRDARQLAVAINDALRLVERARDVSQPTNLNEVTV